MKATSFLISGLSLVAFLQWGCKESPINIPELTVGDRKVLVEELTGVRCTNCPDGARTLLSLQSAKGSDKLIIVSNHSAGVFSLPYNDSKYDFRSAEALSMSTYVGQATGFPTAAVNRVLPANAIDTYVGAGQWASLVDQQLSKPNVVNMVLDARFDSLTRRVSLSIEVVPLVDLSEEHRITVLFTQDKMVDVQLDNGVKIKDYEHRHVLRGVASSPVGDIISQPFEAGKKITLQYTYTLPDTWKEKDCSVVAFVHHGGTPNKEVLQVAEEHVVQ